MEVTALCSRLLVNVLLLFATQDQDGHPVHKADAAFIHINPNRLQFLEYDQISLRCVGFHGSSDWRVRSNYPSNPTRWETSAGSLDIKPAFAWHSGEYWCENGDGERSNFINITVTAGDVILESPALPVMETQDVSLSCRKRAASPNSPADFYKDGRFSRTGYTGKMTVDKVSKADEGLYKCAVSGAESPESWLAVRVSTEYITPAPEGTTAQNSPETSPHPRSSPDSDQLSIKLAVVFTILCVAALLLVVGLLQYRKRRAACLPPEVPPRDAVLEFVSAHGHADVADPDESVYANVRRQKKKKVHASAVHPNMDIYANVPKRKKKRGHPEEAYAAVKKKNRVSGGANVTNTNRANRGRREVTESSYT